METGIEVYPIETEKIDEQMTKELRKADQLSEDEWAECRSGEGVIIHGDDVYWLDTEGIIVTVPIDDDKNPIKLEVYKENNTDTVRMFPSWTAKITPSNVNEYLSDTSVPLEKFVRRFGTRLEVNFWGIVEFLRELGAMPEEMIG